MDALISGRNGLALVMDRGQLASIHADRPDQLLPRHPGEYRFLIGEGRDFFAIEDVSRDEIVRQLKLAQAREEALTLTLGMMDSDLSEELRMEVAEELEVLFEREEVVHYVEGVLYAKPLPRGADLIGGLKISRQAGAHRILTLLERAKDRQHEVVSVREAWDAIPTSTFGGERERWQSIAVREGFFRSLVLCYAENRDFQVVFLEATKNHAIHSLPNYRSVLMSWISPFVQAAASEGRGYHGRMAQAGFVAEPNYRWRRPRRARSRTVRLATESSMVPEALDRLRRAILSDGFLEVVSADAPAEEKVDFEVVATHQGFEIRDASSGRPLAGVDPIPLSISRAERLASWQLVHVAYFYDVLEIMNDDATSPLYDGLELELFGLPGRPSGALSTSELVALPRLPHVRFGDWLCLRLKNASESVLYVALLDLQFVDWRIEQVFPSRGASFHPIEADEVLLLPFELSATGNIAEPEVIKAIGTLEPTSFSQLQLPPIGRPGSRRYRSLDFSGMEWTVRDLTLRPRPRLELTAGAGWRGGSLECVVTSPTGWQTSWVGSGSHPTPQGTV